VRPVRSSECVDVLLQFGFAIEGYTPIRVVLKRAGRRLFVPRHGTLSEDELRAIEHGAGFDRVDFEQALDAHAARDRARNRPSGISPKAPSTPPAALGLRMTRWG
jgi:hypothetical protein